ncbi:succinylglutamate desuccinylase/aspartoacylase family protein [Maridesulfovibrio sp. FT414]|uniref:succinylglutamate desuccinylase/aspartoacylase family protein n=1 Tax=Maridesulfovibrio sp. FT414 TaxID=2979469 RepID=UPI003D80664B
MTTPPIHMCGQTIPAGSHTTVSLPVPDTSLGQGLSMPVHVYHGRRPGPAFFVSAAIHGDELNGIEIVRRLTGLRRLSRLRGTLYAIPIVNIYGFMSNTRYLPDRRDLNRVFPGKAGGSLASELALILFEHVVSRCRYGIDLHTGSNHRANFPHLRGDMKDETIFAMAQAFGAPLVLDSCGVSGSLRQAAEQVGVKTLLYEAGEALRFDEFSIRAGLRGITSLMSHLGMLPVVRKKQAPISLQVAYDRTWCRAPESGLFHAKVKLGQRVKKDELLGTVHDPLGNRSCELLSPRNGVVIGQLALPSVYKGDAIMHIACFKAPGRAEALADEFSELVMDQENPI